MSTIRVRYIVDDVATAVDFYVHHLDFHLIGTCAGWTTLYRGGLHLHLSSPEHDEAGPALPDGRVPEPGGWNRIQLSTADLDAAVTTLRQAGVRIRSDIIEGAGGRQVLLEDPAGNPVELFQPSDVGAGVGGLHDRGLAKVRWVLDALPRRRSEGTVLFAAAAAQRTFNRYDELPREQRLPYSESWRPTLEAVWSYAAGDYRQHSVISAALGRFYLSPQHHNEGPEGPEGADEDEVAATIYAAEAAMHGLVDFAVFAAGRALDAIWHGWDWVDEERLVAETHAELARQSADLLAIQEAVQRPVTEALPLQLLRKLRGR